jgi:hypothetical protein
MRGATNNLLHIWWNGSQWCGWENLGGNFASAPTVCARGLNHLDIFVRGFDNQLYHKGWDGSRWSGWENLGGNLTCDPAVVSWGVNRMDCFARGTTNNLLRKYWNGSQWSGWENFGGNISSSPTACSWSYNRIDVFVRGIDQHLYHIWWNGTNWFGWENLGGILASAPTAAAWEYNRIDCFVRGTDDQLWQKSWFPKSYEDIDHQVVGYASNEEDRFADNVWDFIDEFGSTWPCSQYYWGERRFLQEDHLDFVDGADLAFISGHGNVSYIKMNSTEGCHLDECSWGSYSSPSRKGDLEFIAFESCLILSLDGDWRERWQSAPDRKRPFSGLHMACGFTTNHGESPVFELSDEFAENLEDGFSVRWAWLEATDDENDWVWWRSNVGCVMYIQPHQNETINGNSFLETIDIMNGIDPHRDRWYHDADYRLLAEHWVY